MKNPLVSIIIPTYNRAHLIDETLESIISQTYINWECIVVDDGSSDTTLDVLKKYCDKDSRMQFYIRPKNTLKGANACRNFGFKMSKGDYIQWFDSDDLMDSCKIKTKVDILAKNELDFVVAKTAFFKTTKENLSYVEYDIDNPNLLGFVSQQQFWCTPDIMFTQKSLLNVRWNETLKSGQEFNFISKYLLGDKHGKFINNVLSFARVHDNSIHSHQNKNKSDFIINKHNVYLETFLEFNERNIEDNDEVLMLLLDKLMKFSFKLSIIKVKINSFASILKYVFLFKGLKKLTLFLLSIFSGYIFGRGDKLNVMSY